MTRLVSIAKAARLFSIPKNRLYRMRDHGQLPLVQMGTRSYVNLDVLADYLKIDEAVDLVRWHDYAATASTGKKDGDAE